MGRIALRAAQAGGGRDLGQRWAARGGGQGRLAPGGRRGYAFAPVV